MGSTFEERPLEVLGSQIRHELGDRVRDKLKALKTLKKNGHKVGGLKFRPFVNSIPLKQYGSTHKVDRKRNRARIQRLGWFRVLGLGQIPKSAELASAVLVRRPSGYYLRLTCYVPTDGLKRSERFGKPVGVDLGVKDKLSLSCNLPTRCSPEPHTLVPVKEWLLAREEGLQ